MPNDHDTVIADPKADVRSFFEARNWDQAHGPKEARGSNRKAP